MKANELRIGNLLFFPFTEEHIKILGINAHETNEGIVNSLSFKNGKNLYCEKITALKPIPLTEKWLSNFGYSNKNRPNHFQKDEYTINAHIFWDCNGMFIDDKNGVYVKYVHQLQNLYFALHQKELIIKDQE